MVTAFQAIKIFSLRSMTMEYICGYLVGTLWVTVLDSTNPLAVRAMNTAAPAFVMYLVSAVLLVAGGFFKGAKNAD